MSELTRAAKVSIAKSILQALMSEIDWCKKHRTTQEREYEDGFIRGLRQAIYIIKKVML